MQEWAIGQASSNQVICTLFEGDYHLGVGALLNSILRAGFKGLFWAGYRGNLPPWTVQLRKIGPELFELSNGAQLKFEKLDPAMHFAHYKPELMLDLIRRGIATRFLWYFDPDITVRCSWKFFQTWARLGVALCSDVTTGYMPEKHPIRCIWVENAMAAGWPAPVAVQTRYFNSGFVGLDIAHASFLERWNQAIEIAAQSGVDIKEFKSGTREAPYHFLDQDSLNVATMYANEPILPIGPEGMGFIYGGFTMFHAVGEPKPWKKKFLLSALRGIPPGMGDKHFLASADGTIRLYPAGKLRLKRMEARIGALIGRFYGRR